MDTFLNIPAEIPVLTAFPQCFPAEGPVVLVHRGVENEKLQVLARQTATLVEILQPGAKGSLDISLGENARLRYIRIVSEGANASSRIVQERESALEFSILLLGGDNAHRTEIQCAEKTDTRLYGLALPKADEQVRNVVRLYHQKPFGQSRQVFKYVANDRSKAVFDGKIIVEKGAQKIEAYQKNNNILLSPSARVESDPQLEIYADDVRCSHGATVGQLDETALFYLQSRGIPLSTARKMLLRSFVEESLEGITLPWLRQAVEKMIDLRLG